jgi:hypothetical protein
VLAAHVYYHDSRHSLSVADNRSGFVAVLTMTAGTGPCEASRRTGWKSFRSSTFSADKVFGYNTQFNEKWI